MIRWPFLAKSGLCAAFFYAHAALGAPSMDALAQHPVWQALIHARNGKPQLEDAGFLLSSPHFSPARELQASLDYLYSGPADAVCRFPARYQFLRAELNTPALPLESCADIQEFRARAPADEIALVFATENLSSPASMMGHVFLKLSGLRADGQRVDHSISFYTDTVSVNVPRLMYESMVSGLPGYFSLSPYPEALHQYLDNDQRNVWEYPLQLTPIARERLLLHLMELRNARFTYFFQSYNCATVVLNILRTSGAPLPASGVWLTPREVVHQAGDAGLIKDAHIRPSDGWIISTLTEQLPPETPAQVRRFVVDGTPLPPDSPLTHLLARRYTHYARESGSITPDVARQREAQLATEPLPPLELSNLRTPLVTPPEGQLYARLGQLGTTNQAVIGLLPGSHTLMDDNRSRNSESGLQLFDSAVRIRQNGELALDHFTLYSLQALTPRNALTGGIAGKFGVGIADQLDRQLNPHRAGFIEGAAGLDMRPLPDMDVYALAGLGLGRSQHTHYAYNQWEAGLILREVLRMKTLASYSQTRGQLGDDSTLSRWRLVQSHYLTPRESIFLEFSWEDGKNAHRQGFWIGFKHLF